MGNIGSQNGNIKYKSSSPDNLQWPHSFPRSQTKYQQNQLKVLPEKTPKIRLRHTENGEILQTGGTLTGRQIQNKLCETREIKKCDSEPYLHNLVNAHHTEHFESEKDRKFRKKYKAPPPPTQSNKFKEHSPDYWDNQKQTPPKPRLFKTKIQTERKRSVPDYHDKTDYPDLSHKSLQSSNINYEDNIPYPPPLHRLSLPALNTPAWDFQGELKEATRRLRKIRSDDKEDVFSSEENIIDETNKNKLKTLDHHIDRRDIFKLKVNDFGHSKIKNDDDCLQHIRNEASGKESSIEESSLHVSKERKCEAPKPFYFGMSSSHKSISSPKEYTDIGISSDIKPCYFDSADGIQHKNSLPKITQDFSRYSPVANWKQSSSAESVINPTPSKEAKYSSEEAEEPPRVFSIFPTRSLSNDRSRSGDSGISGDGSPVVYEDNSDALITTKNGIKSSQPLIPGWTPQQDLGDDSSFEEESFSAGDYPDTYDAQTNQRHVFSLSLPRDHHLASYAPDQNETNFDKIRRSVSGILNTINKKEAESTPENERGNWFLNKSCSALNSNSLQLKYSEISDELDDFLTRNTKLNSGRLMYLPKADKSIRPRRYETRNRQRNCKEDKLGRSFTSTENLVDNQSKNVPESLQDSPIMSDRKTFKKKPKRFTFQSTIRQIERKRIAEKLSREAEKKEQQRLRELEVMQKVEREFQKKRAREKVSIKQQLSRYTHENPSSDSKIDINPQVVRDALQARSEPDGAVSSSPTSSLSQLDNKQEQRKLYEKNNMDYVNNNREYKSSSDTSDDARSKPIMQTQILSEYRQPQREYRDYHSSKKYTADGLSVTKQTTVHPKVTYKMPKSKGSSRHSSNNYRKDFAYGITAKSEKSWSQPTSQTKRSPTKYYSQFGPLTRF